MVEDGGGYKTFLSFYLLPSYIIVCVWGGLTFPQGYLTSLSHAHTMMLQEKRADDDAVLNHFQELSALGAR